MIDSRDLNKSQLEAVTTPIGPVIVNAGPGSGKTKVLTYRIAYMIETFQINPRSILVATFTKKVASEMKKRVETLIGDPAKLVNIGTFHSVCARILRNETSTLGIQGFQIADVSMAEKILRKTLQRLDLDEKNPSS